MKRNLKIAASILVIIGGGICSTILGGHCGEVIAEKLNEWIEAD